MQTPESHSPLAIVGIGCLFPKAAGPGFFWANVKHGADGITEVPATHWNPDDYFDADPKKPDMTYARRGGFLSAVEFNPLEFGIAPRDIEATDTTQLLGLVAAKQALTDAGVVLANPDRKVGGESDKKTVDRNRVSVILGVTGTLELVIPLGARLGHPKWKRAMRDAGIPAELAEDAAARIAESYVPWQENSFPGLLGNVVAGRIANKLDLGGTNCVVDAACASSLSAVHLAALELQAGRCDVAVTGGCDTFNDIFMYMCFSKTPALSPTGDAKPFDAEGDGTILGEGLGVVVLKRLADAERDADTIYAVLKGVGSSSDGKGKAIYEPSSAGQKKALLAAYQYAGITPDTIELVEAHGTGTRVGDTVEITALTDVYTAGGASTKPRPWAAIGSVKSQIGHTKAAAGAASLIKATLAIYNKVLPPTIKVKNPVEPLRAADSPFYVSGEMRPWLPRREHPRRAALSAFGFGGSNFHAVLEEHRAQKLEPDWDGSVEVIALGADSPKALADAVAKLSPEWNAFALAAEAARANFNPSAACRLCFAAHRTLTDLPKLLATAKTKLASDPNAQSWHTPDGLHYGRGPAGGKLAVLFPGQGSQFVGMLRELVCLFPEALDALAVANDAVAAFAQDESDARRLSDRIFPPTTFDSEKRKQYERELRDTRNAQPGIGAVSFGAWRVLSERFGLKADCFAGHSYGELVALAAAGRLAPRDLFTMSRIRGQLMADSRPGDSGSMLACFAAPAEIEAVLAREKLDVVVANRNAPKQTVLSGPTAHIERAARLLSEVGMKATPLPVAAAFHSALVADAAVPFRAALDGAALAAGAPVYANTTAAEYPADESGAKDLLANQLAKPVAFVEQIRAMAEAGVRTFVEVGLGSVLTRLVEAILADVPGAAAEAFALDASGGKRSGVLDLGNALARLAAAGHAVALAAWERESRCRPQRPPTGKPGLTVSVCGANSVLPRAPRPPRAPQQLISANGNGKHPSTALLARPKGSAMSDSSNAPGPADPSAFAQALAMTQQSLAALQRMQEQTAALHKQFLDTQETAGRTLQALIDQQQALLLSGLGAGVALPAPVAPAPRPTPTAPAPSVPLPAPVVSSPAPVPAPYVPAPRSGGPPPTTILPASALPPEAFATPRSTVQPKPVPAPAPRAPARDQVAATLLAVVSEKTGYPVESLDLALSLDADLGVDSIKRVEILSALQEKLPEAPVVKPEHLGTLHTLKDVADFLAGPAPTSAPAPAPAEATAEDDDVLVRTPSIGSEFLPLRGNSADVAATLLAVVSEKTGYPVESLDLALSLDADLGVDSIKRVEILSALQEKLPEAPVVKPEHLGTLHTLKDVADFLAGGPAAPATTKISMLDVSASLLTKPLTPQVEVEPAAPDGPVPDTVQLSGQALPRAGDSGIEGQPKPKAPSGAVRTQGEMVRPPGASFGSDRIDRSTLQIADLDIGTQRARLPLPSGGEFWVVADADPLTDAVAAELKKRGLNPRVLAWGARAATKPSAGPLAGLLLLAPGAPGPDSGLNRKAFDWLKLAAGKLRQGGRSSASVFATVARLDGAFGLADLSPDADATAGGLAGLVKTARQEWPEVNCKALDLAPAFADPGAAAAAVLDEVLAVGPVEIGIAPTHRCTLELARTARRPNAQLINLGARDVILVTGGGRGVTAEAAVALAETYCPTLVLTGRTPAPTPEPAYLAGVTSEPEMKKAIADALGAEASPRTVGDVYKKVLAQREVRSTLERIQRAGARAAYFPVNITDGKAVADLLHQVRVKFGPVTALVHGAGVLADKRIEDLSGEQFDTVYSTKVDGLRTLLDLLAHEELKALVLFSSTTARLGRVGQLAYACANEVLNKTAQAEAKRRPGSRVVAINWGPWDGGMVTPGLRKMFETEGVGVIPLLDGAMFLIQELNAAGRAVEVIALAKPPTRQPGSGSVPKPGSGSTPPPVGTSAPVMSPPNPLPSADMALAFERVVDVLTHPVLKSHVLDGLAVLPVALHLEWLAHAALHGNPGLQFHGFNDLRVTNGLKIEAGGQIPLRALAGKATKQDKTFIVPVELRGKRKDGRELIFSRAEIVLAPSLPKPPPADAAPVVAPVSYDVPRAYREFLFHGPDLQGIAEITGRSARAFVGSAYPAPQPADWFEFPLRSGWVAEPLVLDTAFQMMILWTQGEHHTGSLPSFIGRYRQFRKSYPADPITIVVRVTRDDSKFARADIDFLAPNGQVVAQMQDYECVMEPTLNASFRKNQIVIGH